MACFVTLSTVELKGSVCSNHSCACWQRTDLWFVFCRFSFFPFWIYSSKRRNVFPGTGKDFLPLNPGMSQGLCTSASAFQFPAEFPLWNLHSSLKKAFKQQPCNVLSCTTLRRRCLVLSKLARGKLGREFVSYSDLTHTHTPWVIVGFLMNCFIECSPVRNLILSPVELSEICVHSAKVLNVL